MATGPVFEMSVWENRAVVVKEPRCARVPGVDLHCRDVLLRCNGPHILPSFKLRDVVFALYCGNPQANTAQCGFLAAWKYWEVVLSMATRRKLGGRLGSDNRLESSAPGLLKISVSIGGLRAVLN
jgi:hypothetical protein